LHQGVNLIRENLYKTSADNLKSSAYKQILVSLQTIAFYTNLLHPHNYRHIIDYWWNNYFVTNFKYK